MRLLCRHITFIRKFKGMSLFDDSLYSKRWTVQYFKENQRYLRDVYGRVTNRKLLEDNENRENRSIVTNIGECKTNTKPTLNDVNVFSFTKAVNSNITLNVLSDNVNAPVFTKSTNVNSSANYETASHILLSNVNESTTKSSETNNPANSVIRCDFY